MTASLRALPSVDEVLSRPAVRALEDRLGRDLARAAVRRAIAAARARLLAADATQGQPGDELVSDDEVLRAAELETAPRLRRVLNATGVVLHTNLGRAPLHPEAIARVAEVASGYSNLELDLATGQRGSRTAPVEPLLCGLFSAEAAHVVNNCAGATLLALAALAKGAAAIVSRGELVEIGGGFRVPEILAQSGCKLVEVGTTNRTRIADYAAALDALGPGAPAVLLRVHRSNFALVGFTEEPTVQELAALAHARGLLLLHDLGSGAVELPETVPQDATARRSLEAGADVVLISGDKLLGGPQAGIALGRAALIEKLRRHPLSRALRADRMLLAALEVTLQLHRQGRARELPALAALALTPREQQQRATRLSLLLSQRGIASSVAPAEGQVGGGSLPLARPPGAAVRLQPQEPAALLAALREGATPVVALLRDGAVLLHVACLPADDLAELAQLIEQAWKRSEDADGPTGATLGVDGTEV